MNTTTTGQRENIEAQFQNKQKSKITKKKVVKRKERVAPHTLLVLVCGSLDDDIKATHVLAE
jgi:hypothetical protein